MSKKLSVFWFVMELVDFDRPLAALHGHRCDNLGKAGELADTLAKSGKDAVVFRLEPEFVSKASAIRESLQLPISPSNVSKKSLSKKDFLTNKPSSKIKSEKVASKKSTPKKVRLDKVPRNSAIRTR
jgi:hypothetical protein